MKIETDSTLCVYFGTQCNEFFIPAKNYLLVNDQGHLMVKHTDDEIFNGEPWLLFRQWDGYSITE